MNFSASLSRLNRFKDHIARGKIQFLAPCIGCFSSSQAHVGCSIVDRGIEDSSTPMKKWTTTAQWNSAIRECVNSCRLETALFLFCAMRDAAARLDHFTLPLINRAISSLTDCFHLGEAVHGLGVRMGFENDIYFCNTMIEVYVRYGFITLAHQLFDEMCFRDVVSWTSLISGYVQIGYTREAFRLFQNMEMDDLEPSSVTLVVILRACSIEKDILAAKQLHGFAVKLGLESHELVQNSILTAFSKGGCLEDVNELFSRCQKNSVIAWNILISGFFSSGDVSEVISCYEKMKIESYPSHETLTMVISALAQSRDLKNGEKLHCYATKSGQIDAILQSALIDFYAKCAQLSSSVLLFEEMKMLNSVAWSAMLWGFIHNSKFLDIIYLFGRMQEAGIEPCSSTVRALVLAYTHLGSLKLGKGIHGFLLRKTSYLNTEETSVATSILMMYAKCGSIISARRCFDLMIVKDAIAWSSMIEACSVHGQGSEALALFSRMQEGGIRPNSVTFLSLLCACSHSGLVHEGCAILDCMTKRYRIKPELCYYTCLVDLLGRAGKLHEALQVINNMNIEPDGRIWGSLLASCRKYSNAVLGNSAARGLLNLESDNVGYHVVLSNILAGGELWHGSEDVWNTLLQKGLERRPGWSCIDVQGRLHVFISGDRLHLKVAEIYDTLGNLSKHIRGNSEL